MTQDSSSRYSNLPNENWKISYDNYAACKSEME